ncbi:MAG: translation initiation factor IF-2 N-terminal domain-containing protein, partial [Gaiellaceae bacterium]
MADRQRPLRPRGGGGAGGRRKRRVVIDSQAARPRQDSRAPREAPKPRPEAPAPPPPKGPAKVNSGANIRDLSAAVGVTVPEILKILMGLGDMKTVTQSLTDQEIQLIATELKREVEI